MDIDSCDELTGLTDMHVQLMVDQTIRRTGSQVLETGADTTDQITGKNPELEKYVSASLSALSCNFLLPTNDADKYRLHDRNAFKDERMLGLASRGKSRPIEKRCIP